MVWTSSCTRIVQSPVAAVNVWYHVGSKDEEIGRTGFAHLFEHIMFRGTKHHKASHFEPLQKIGATLNGSTTGDRTNYWEDVPSNYLELALWLEADRMGFLLDALDQEGFRYRAGRGQKRAAAELREPALRHGPVAHPASPVPAPSSLPLDDHRLSGRSGRRQPGRRQRTFSAVSTRRPTPASPSPATSTPARRWAWRSNTSRIWTLGQRCAASPAPTRHCRAVLSWK